MNRTRLPIALLALALAGAPIACGAPASPDGAHAGRGVVRSVDAARGEVTLQHGDIDGLMKAMTMTFEAEPAILEGLAAGQEVDFRVKEEDGRYVVTEIRPGG